MGVASALGKAFGIGVPRPDYLASPWSDTQLATVVYADIFGASALAPLSRAQAMGIPALSKARNLIVGTIAKLPLKAQNKDGLLSDAAQPTWLYRTDGALSPFLRRRGCGKGSGVSRPRGGRKSPRLGRIALLPSSRHADGPNCRDSANEFS